MSLLLEALVGMGLFATAVLMTLSLFPSAASALSQAKEVGEANALARDVMENQLAKSYSNIVAVPGPSGYNVTNVDRGALVTQQFIYSVDVTQPTGYQNYKSLNVTVKWTHGNLLRQVQLQDCKSGF
jgi:hypothetical protein